MAACELHELYLREELSSIPDKIVALPSQAKVRTFNFAMHVITSRTLRTAHVCLISLTTTSCHAPSFDMRKGNARATKSWSSWIWVVAILKLAVFEKAAESGAPSCRQCARTHDFQISASPFSSICITKSTPSSSTTTISVHPPHLRHLVLSPSSGASVHRIS